MGGGERRNLHGGAGSGGEVSMAAPLTEVAVGGGEASVCEAAERGVKNWVPGRAQLGLEGLEKGNVNIPNY